MSLGLAQWAVLALALLAVGPAARWLQDRPSLRLQAWTAVGMLPFLAPLDIGLVTFGNRAGDTAGFEVALVDALALTLLMASPPRDRPAPYRMVLGAYLLVAVLASLGARWPVGALGYVWKTCRMYLLFAAVWRAGADPRVPAALLRGMTVGVVSELVWTGWQHFVLGMHQATGSFVHQNTLGMVVNLVVPASVALVLSGPAGMPWTAAPITAVPTCLFTVSRGAILFLGAGTVLAYLGSAARRFDLRKMRFGIAGAVAGLALVPLAVSTLGTRTAEGQAESLNQRWRYEKAAELMLRDHPLGVGPNHFTATLSQGGYADRAGVDWFARVGIVHNVYWLTAAEMGWAGLLALLALFAAPVLTVLRSAFRRGSGRGGDVLVGLGAGLLVVHVHGLFEWVWRTTEVSYVYWMAVGMVAALGRPA